MKKSALILGLTLGGCGLSDQFSIMPSFLRYEPSKARDDSAPDTVALAKQHGRSLFAHRPDEIEISTAFYDARLRAWSACARVVDAGHPMMTASIGHTGFIARWRAEPDDGCARLNFTRVTVD